VEACPSGAIHFGDLNDPATETARSAHLPDSFRMLESLATDPKIYYRSKKNWVREISSAPRPGSAKEAKRG
jgi:Fe-S-cluster-containing dehydrogenase component